MADQQDEFFVEPEVQEVRDLSPPTDAVELHPHQSKQTCQETQHVHLKMLEIPKEEAYSHYRPFRFEHVSESQSSQEAQQVPNTTSVIDEFYGKYPCVYQRYNNRQLNKVSNVQHFTGLFAHRKVLLQTNCKQIHQLADALKQQYGIQDSSTTLNQEQDLIFDSKFESGNLFSAYKISQFQYDLMMSTDTNSLGGSNQWFYFSVTNLIPGKNYTFSIVNFTKSDSLFNYGMAPAVYSMCENRYLENLEHGWHRVGKEISYKKGKLPRQNSKRYYYCLKFTLMTAHEKDKLFVAHSYPYTNQKLKTYLTQKVNKNHELVTRFTIGKTISKRPIQALTICHPINKKRDNRKAIIFMARQHPGETQGSFVCEGVIDKLLQKNKQNDFLLKNYIFYVIPMVNPDGVVFGHYRCNLLGKDLNRKWNATEKDQNSAEVVAIKTFLQEISKEREIRFIIDLHGHSKKLNSFFYGNPCVQHPQVVRIFPFICSKLHQGIQFLDCTFATQEHKKKAARVYLSTFYNLIHVYTFESSFYAYFQDGKKIQFTPKEYRKLGGSLVHALGLQLQHQIKYQQSFQFNLKQNNTKEYINSLFVKYLSQLKKSKILINAGKDVSSGSESQPQQGQLNNEQMESLWVNKQESQLHQNGEATVKAIRKGIKEHKDSNRTYQNQNRPIRNIRYLQMSKINSVLPDRFQLALQPIKKKESLPDPITQKPFNFPESPAGESKYDIKMFELKGSHIQSCNLENSEKYTSVTERRLSSLVHSMNNNRNNIIVKVENNFQSVPRPSRIAQIHTRAIKNAFSQTMITFEKDKSKNRSSQILPAVQGTQRERYDLIWPKISQMNIGTTIRGPDITKQAENLFNGMVKRFINQKQIYKKQQISNRNFREKISSFRKNQYLKK